MGLGNGNAKSGDKGSNHNFEHRQLLSLGAISAFVGAGATEATLQLVLTAIQLGSEFEARLVEDALSVTWLEVRTWNTSGGTWNPPLYYPAGSNTPGSPTLPVTYINNSSVLATIASNTTGLATQTTLLALFNKIIIDTDDGAIATDQVLPTNISVLYAEGDGVEVRLKTDYSPDRRLLVDSKITGTVPLPTGAATEVTLAALNAKLNSLGQKASAGSAPVVLSTEQEAILAAISGYLLLIEADTGNILTDTNAMVVDLAAIEILITAINGKLINDYGAAAAALRTAAQIGNTTGEADFNNGAPTAQTLRVALANPDTVTPQVVTSILAVDNTTSPVALGASAIGFTTDTLFVGTINGIAREASTFYGFEAAPGKTLPAIAYTVIAGTMVIDKIV